MESLSRVIWGCCTSLLLPENLGEQDVDDSVGVIVPSEETEEVYRGSDTVKLEMVSIMENAYKQNEKGYAQSIL